MAEGFLKRFDGDLKVFSAGTRPASEIHPLAIKVMSESGIDLNGRHPKSVDPYPDMDFDYVITVCDHAKETCPIFTGKVNHRLHMGFEDPANFVGTEDEILDFFRKIRDEIKDVFWDFYQNRLKS